MEAATGEGIADMKVKEASKFFWMAQVVCITECVILSYHTPL